MDISYYKKLLYSDKYSDIFSEFYSMVLYYNSKFNLTSITDKNEFYKKHFLDSIVGEKFIDKNSYCCEIGSGAGFPSVPLMFIRSDLHFVLIESSRKKASFLNDVIKKFNLSAYVLNERAETVGRMASYRESFDYCVIRGVASLPVLLEYTSPLLSVNGYFLAYKSKVEEEINYSKKAMNEFHLFLEASEEFFLQGSNDFRTLLLFKKCCILSNKYPRTVGAPVRNPIT